MRTRPALRSGGSHHGEAAEGSRLDELHRAVVVAVVGVRVMQAPVDEEVRVAVVWHRLMAASRTMLVVAVMAAGGACVPFRMRRVYRKGVLVDMVVVRVMQMTVVQVVDVSVVAHGGVPAPRAVNVNVVAMDRVVSAHVTDATAAANGLPSTRV